MAHILIHGSRKASQGKLGKNLIWIKKGTQHIKLLGWYKIAYSKKNV